MKEDWIRTLMSGEFRLPETGRKLRCPIQKLLVEPSLDGCERDVLEELGLASSPTIVCDAHTHDVLARRVASAIPGARLIVLEHPRADKSTADLLTDRTRHAEVLIAVGSGTLNDLVKYVSHLRQRPYAVFATAPSMNGYVTATASISRDGEKLSLQAAPPIGAFFDLAVLADAPSRLVRAGVGDSLCRSTAQLDWLLCHHLFDTRYLEAPFVIQARDEQALLTRVGDLQRGEPDAFMALVRLLVLGGFGMLIAGSSQPGSQGEHLISHYIDMLHHPHPGSLHGEQVGLATRTMAALQHDVLTRSDPPFLTETRIDAGTIERRFGSSGASSLAALTKKALTGDRLKAANRRLAERWPALRAAFVAKAPPLDKLQAALDKAGVAADPNDLGIAPAFYGDAIRHAREVRDRFTMLDLAADAGLLDRFVERHL